MTDPQRYDTIAAFGDPRTGAPAGRPILHCRIAGCARGVANRDCALDGGRLRSFPFRSRLLERIVQMERSRGVTGFAQRGEDVRKDRSL